MEASGPIGGVVVVALAADGRSLGLGQLGVGHATFRIEPGHASIGHGHLADLRAHGRGSDSQQFVLQRGDSQVGGVAVDPGAAAPAQACIPEHLGGVQGLDVDGFQRRLEFLRHQLPKHRVGAAALVHGRGRDRDGPVRIDGHEGVALAPQGQPLGNRHATPGVGALGSAIAGLRDGLVQGLLGLDVVQDVAGGRLVAVMHQVDLPELHRIHAQFLRHRVHLALGGEEALRIARRPHVSARDLVGVHHALFAQVVRHVVRASRLLSAEEKPDGLEGAVGAAVEDEVEVVRHDPAVPLDPGAHPDGAGVARVPGHELLVVIHDHLHRAPALPGQCIGHGNVHEVALAAEVAADVAGMDHQALERHLERSGKLLAQGERGLAAGPDLRRPRRVHAHQTGVGLDVTLVHGLGVERVLDDDLGLVESLLDVPLAPGKVHEGVGGRLQRGHEALITHDVRMDQRSRRLDRLQRVQNRIEILVFHLDEIHRPFRRLLAVGGHRRHLLAHEAHHVLRQDGTCRTDAGRSSARPHRPP